MILCWKLCKLLNVLYVKIMESEYRQRRRRPKKQEEIKEEDLYIIRDGPYVNYRDVVQRMLDGVDISLVEPVLYPRLIPHIEYYIEYYTEARDEYAVRDLRYYLKYIEDEPRLREIEEMLREPDPPPQKPPALTPSQVKKEVKQIWNTEKIRAYSHEELDLVVAGMKKLRLKFITQGDYLSAQRAEELSRKLISNGQLCFVETMQEDKEVSLKEKLREAERELEESKAKWERLHEGMLAARKREFEGLQKEHTEEIRKLEALYDAPLPPEIRKYSQALLQLRRREKAMLQIKNFAGAAGIKQQADELEAFEDEKQIADWHAKIDDKIRKCRERQQKYVNGRRMYWAKEEQDMVGQANKEVSIAEKQIAHLKENIGVTVKAKNLAKVLRTARNKPTSELPAVKTRQYAMTPKEKDVKQDFQHRRILNAKIYTRTPTRPLTSRQKKTRPGTALERQLSQY